MELRRREPALMKPFMTRVYDRLESATLQLARSGAIKDRLEGAWRQCLANLEADDVPHEWRRQFIELSGQMQRERPLRGEDAVRATIRKMSNDEAEGHAVIIVRMLRMASESSNRRHIFDCLPCPDKCVTSRIDALSRIRSVTHISRQARRTGRSASCFLSPHCAATPGG